MKYRIPVDISRAILPGIHKFPHQEFYEAPYGLLWYMINIPLADRIPDDDPLQYILVTAGGNAFASIVCVTFHLPFLFILFFEAVAMFNLLKAPWNCSILWLCLLGFINPILLVLPILAKFPIGNVRARRGQIVQALTWQKNPYYYSTLVLVWLATLYLTVPQIQVLR